MKKTLLIILSLAFGILSSLFAQTKQERFQGIWEEIIIDNPESDETHIKIINGIKSISISHQGEGYLDFYLVESIESFINDYFFDEITLDSLDVNGKYYIMVFNEDVNNGEIRRKPYMLGGNLYFEENHLIIEGSQLAEYISLDNLPQLTMRLLYLRGKKDNRNYIKNYLNIDVKEIIVPKSIIYSEPKNPTKMYLIQGDIVTILEEKNDWIKIEYNNDESGKEIIGWIKRKDIEQN